MADTGDPVGAGGVPPGNAFALAAQMLAGLVELAGQRGGGPLFGQLHRAAGGKLLQALLHIAQAAVHAPGKQHAGQHDDEQVDKDDRAHRGQQRMEQVAFHIKAVAHERTFWIAEHERAVVGQVAHDGVVFEIPTRKRYNLARRIRVIQLGGQVVAVDDLACVVEHHRPVKAVEPFFLGMLEPRARRAGLVQREGVCNLAGAERQLEIAAVGHGEDHPERDDDVQNQHAQRNADARQHIAADEFDQRSHAFPSPASL